MLLILGFVTKLFFSKENMFSSSLENQPKENLDQKKRYCSVFYRWALASKFVSLWLKVPLLLCFTYMQTIFWGKSVEASFLNILLYKKLRIIGHYYKFLKVIRFWVLGSYEFHKGFITIFVFIAFSLLNISKQGYFKSCQCLGIT